MTQEMAESKDESATQPSEQVAETNNGSAPQHAEQSRDFESVVDRMRRLLDETFAGFGTWSPVRNAGMWSPPVDIEETDDAYLLEAELPGVEPSDVDVELVGNELTITGEVKAKERNGVVRRSTRRTGRFDYRIALPGPLNADEVEASLTNGVLKVRVPKTAAAQRRKIELTAA